MSAKSKSSGDTVPSFYHLTSFILTKCNSGLDKLTFCNCSFTMHETNCMQPVSLGVLSVLRCKLPLQILHFHAISFFHLFGLHSPAISAVSLPPTVHVLPKYGLYRISCLICHEISFSRLVKLSAHVGWLYQQIPFAPPSNVFAFLPIYFLQMCHLQTSNYHPLLLTFAIRVTTEIFVKDHQPRMQRTPGN